MTINVTANGTLQAAPAGVTDTSTFPAGSDTIPFQLLPATKTANVDTGPMRPIVNSSSAFVAMPGVGAAGPVTQATTLYFRCASPMALRLTTVQPSGPNVVSVVPVMGMVLWEFPSDHYLSLLEVQGAGQVEYYASGNA